MRRTKGGCVRGWIDWRRLYATSPPYVGSRPDSFQLRNLLRQILRPLFQPLFERLDVVVLPVLAAPFIERLHCVAGPRDELVDPLVDLVEHELLLVHLLEPR